MIRFKRQCRVFRGPPDFFPAAGVFFMLMLFVVLGCLVYTPGLAFELPSTTDTRIALTGTTNRTVTIAVTADRLYFFENQLIQTNQIQQRLELARQQSSTPLTLVVLADKGVQNEVIVQLGLVAQQAGIGEMLLAVRPPASRP